MRGKRAILHAVTTRLQAPKVMLRRQRACASDLFVVFLQVHEVGVPLDANLTQLEYQSAGPKMKITLLSALFAATAIAAPSNYPTNTTSGPDENGKYEISADGIRGLFIPYGASISNLFIKGKDGVEMTDAVVK